MFKYGIALINRLKYSQKFLLVGIVCLLPLLVALILLINRLNDQIVFSAKERLGLEYCITLRQMIDDLQQHRGMANSYLNGDASFKEKVAAKDRDVDAGFQRLQSLRVASSDSLLAPDEAAALEATWKQLRNDTAALTPPVSFARHTELIFRLLSLSDKITAVSNLTLDSSLDINLLISVSQKQLLYEIETMAQGRGKGSGIAAKKP